jgi:hypothetical protein
MHWVTANAVSNCPAEASTCAYPCPHAQIVRNAAVPECAGMFPEQAEHNSAGDKIQSGVRGSALT